MFDNIEDIQVNAPNRSDKHGQDLRSHGGTMIGAVDLQSVVLIAVD